MHPFATGCLILKISEMTLILIDNFMDIIATFKMSKSQACIEDNRSRKLSILISVRANLLYSLQYETPCNPIKLEIWL